MMRKTRLVKKLDTAINRVTGGKSSLIPRDRNRRKKFAARPTFQQKARDARTYKPGGEYRRGWKGSQATFFKMRKQKATTASHENQKSFWLLAHPSLTGGCPSQGFRSGLGGNLFVSVGQFHDPLGAFLEIQAPSAPLFLSAHQDSKFHRKAGNSTPVCPDVGASASSNASFGIRKVLGGLFPSLFDTQKVRRMETGTRPETIKQVYLLRTFQDGIPQHSYPSSAAGGLDGLYRPQRRLPAHTNPSRFFL